MPSTEKKDGGLVERVALVIEDEMRDEPATACAAARRAIELVRAEDESSPVAASDQEGAEATGCMADFSPGDPPNLTELMRQYKANTAPSPQEPQANVEAVVERLKRFRYDLCGVPDERMVHKAADLITALSKERDEFEEENKRIRQSWQNSLTELSRLTRHEQTIRDNGFSGHSQMIAAYQSLKAEVSKLRQDKVGPVEKCAYKTGTPNRCCVHDAVWTPGAKGCQGSGEPTNYDSLDVLIRNLRTPFNSGLGGDVRARLMDANRQRRMAARQIEALGKAHRVLLGTLGRTSEAYTRARDCVNFFASVIKSGERWSTTCEDKYRAALHPSEGR